MKKHTRVVELVATMRLEVIACEHRISPYESG